jgi:hypothetical protein
MLRTRVTWLLALVAVAPPFAAPRAQAPSAAWPAPQSGHSMVSHAGLQQVLLLGGGTASGADSVLWGWNGTRWGALGAGGPAGRTHVAMAYDRRRDRLVVHGGGLTVAGRRFPRRMDDTWEWDRRGWRRLSASGPSGRDHHAMAYDPLRRQVVLFGGTDSAGALLDDTWGWDGRRWQWLATGGPPGRAGHRVTFDEKRGVMVLFGGSGASGVLADTWEWNGTKWNEVTTTTAPSARFSARLAYDVRRDRTVLFGGRRGNTNLGDTWEYDGRTWTRLDVAGPALRHFHDLAYDPRAGAAVLFGGFNAALSDDFWRFDGVWKQTPRSDAGPVGGAYVVPGPHAVGYRVIDHWDRSRRTAPARDFEGRLNPDERAMPMQVSIWYPAQPGGTRMRVGEYHAVASRRATLGPITESDVTASAAAIRTGMTFVIGVDVPQATADSIRDLRTAAARDAAPAAGRFPLLVTSLVPIGGHGLAEYLASHGYVVVASLPVGTGSQQVNRVQVALETHTRNMEVAQALASELPFVDAERVGLIGVNFDGLAALTHEMRNMSASAVVSIDGYETKTSSATGLRQSPYYDPVRLRVPYLSVAQDNPPTPSLAFSDSLLRELKYSDRYAYVVRDMDHATLLGNLMVYPQLRAEQRLGYEFVWRTIRSFLDGSVKGDTAGRAFVTRSAVQNGFPAWLVKTEVKAAALPAVPMAEEVEQIAMTGNVERLRTIFRRARAADSAARVFTASDLNLFAFRFARRGNADVAIALDELAVEAFPSSATAANNLGNRYRDAGRAARAVELWERALTLIDADAEITPADKAPSRTAIERKVRQSRPTP